MGRRDAEASYHSQVLPLVKVSVLTTLGVMVHANILQGQDDVFLPEHLDTFYTLDRFHINGSRILSRSFHVEPFLEG